MSLRIIVAFLIFQQVFTFSSSPLWNSSGLLIVDMNNGMLVETMQVEAHTLKNILSLFSFDPCALDLYHEDYVSENTSPRMRRCMAQTRIQPMSQRVSQLTPIP